LEGEATSFERIEDQHAHHVRVLSLRLHVQERRVHPAQRLHVVLPPWKLSERFGTGATRPCRGARRSPAAEPDAAPPLPYQVTVEPVREVHERQAGSRIGPRHLTTGAVVAERGRAVAVSEAAARPVAVVTAEHQTDGA